MDERPIWLRLGERVLGPTLLAAENALKRSPFTDPDLVQTPILALNHLTASLDSSHEANRQGRHSVAIGLIRHGIEALTLIDVGLQEEAFAAPLLEKWRDGDKTSGELRKSLEQEVWPRYGLGLWTESWGEFFGNLSRAVQPYAHVSRELLEWQMVIVDHQFDDRGGIVLRVALSGYDRLKAERIAHLHMLIIWTLARLLLANPRDPSITAQSQAIYEFGAALGSAGFLANQKDLGQELLPTVFFAKKSEPNEA